MHIIKRLTLCFCPADRSIVSSYITAAQLVKVSIVSLILLLCTCHSQIPEKCSCQIKRTIDHGISRLVEECHTLLSSMFVGRLLMCRLMCLMALPILTDNWRHWLRKLQHRQQPLCQLCKRLTHKTEFTSNWSKGLERCQGAWPAQDEDAFPSSLAQSPDIRFNPGIQVTGHLLVCRSTVVSNHLSCGM